MRRGCGTLTLYGSDQNTKDILEVVNFIKDRMLTKDDVRDITREVIRQEIPAMIREEFKPFHHELREINRRLDVGAPCRGITRDEPLALNCSEERLG